MNILSWDGQSGFIIKDVGQIQIFAKPIIGDIKFDAIYYELETDNMRRVLADKTFNLTDDEITTINNYIDVFAIPTYDHYADSVTGAYLGKGEFIGDVVPNAPPTDGNYYWSNGSWVWVLGVDADGQFLGNVSVSDVTEVVPSSPPDSFHKWAAGQWVDTRTLAEFIIFAKKAIDEKTGEVRLRYVTSVAGQAETYNEKLKDAEAFVAATNPVQTDYVYVDAEAKARVVSGDIAAMVIIDTAASWRILGANIEGSRIGGKVKQDGATLIGDAKSMLALSLAELDAF